jgi:hypothetical protein
MKFRQHPFGRDKSIFMVRLGVKSSLNSMELRTRLNGKGSDNQAEGLFVEGRLENSSNFRDRSCERDLEGQSKSKKNV